MPAHSTVPRNQGVVIQSVDPPVFIADFSQFRVEAVNCGHLTVIFLDFKKSSTGIGPFQGVNNQASLAAMPESANPSCEPFQLPVDSRVDLRARQICVRFP